MRFLIFTLIFFTFFTGRTSQAQAVDGSACEDATVQLGERFGNVERFKAQLKIQDALAIAFSSMLCQEQYSHCEFDFCETQGEKRNPALDGLYSDDPLAWLRQPMGCEFLLDQIKSRYGPLGKFSDLPQFKKDEIKVVMDTSCSKRFEHCKFKACGKNVKSIEPGDNKPQINVETGPLENIPPETLAKKRIALESLYFLWRERRNQEIKRIQIEEQAKGTAWLPFRVVQPESE